MSMSQQFIFMSIFPPVVVVVKAVSKQHPSQRRRGRYEFLRVGFLDLDLAISLAEYT